MKNLNLRYDKKDNAEGLLDMTEKQQNVQSLDRAFEILELLCESKNGLSISEISEKTNLHKSTVHRLLGSMVHRNYVKQDSHTSMYYASTKISELGNLVLDHLDIVRLAKPEMEKLCDMVEETVHLVMREGNEIVYIQKVENEKNAMRMFSRIGMRRPMYCTGVGKMLLSACDEKEIRKIWEESEIVPFTPNTIVKYEDLQKALENIQKTGFSMDDEENEIGVRCIAVAIPSNINENKYAISVSAPITRLTEEKIKQWVPLLLQTAQNISFTLR